MSFLIVTKYFGPTNKRGSRVRATLVNHLSQRPERVHAYVSSGEAPSSGDTAAWHRAAAERALVKQATRRVLWRRSHALQPVQETARIVAHAETHDGTGYAFICEWDVT